MEIQRIIANNVKGKRGERLIYNNGGGGGGQGKTFCYVRIKGAPCASVAAFNWRISLIKMIDGTTDDGLSLSLV